MPKFDTRFSHISARQQWTLVVSCLSVALVIASMASLYTSLPEVAVETGATQQQLTWVVDGYTLALSCLVLPAGAIGDRFGRRIVLIIGLGTFTVASCWPLFASEPGWLIASRAAAGVGAAFVMPSTLSIMTAEFPQSERGKAVGIWAGVAGSGGVLGILGAGLLLNTWSWMSIFAGLTAVGAILLIAAVTLPESRDRQHTKIDVAGAFWVAAAIGSIVFAVIETPTRGWLDPVVMVLLASGAACSAVFVVVELRSPHPLLPLQLFGQRGFGSGALSVTLQFLVVFGVFLVLVQYLQLILGYTPLAAALALTPMIGPVVGISLVAPWLMKRFGLRAMSVVGFLTIAVGLYLVSRLDADSDFLDLLWPLVIASSGLGLATAPATFAIVSDTPIDKQGVAAAVNDAAREIGAAIGIALAGSVLASGYSDRIASALPKIPAEARGPVSDSLAAALEVAERGGPAAQPLVDLANSAFIHGATQASLSLTVISLAGAVVLSIWAPASWHENDSSGSSLDPAVAASAETR